MLVALALLSTGCVIHHVRERCDTCVVVDRDRPEPPRLRASTKTLFVLVPGILGYGWEWDEAVAALRAAPDVEFVVYMWNPHRSLLRAADDLAVIVGRLLRETPVREVRIMAHSAGGIVGAYALESIDVPPGRHLKLVTIGSPLAGMKGAPSTLDDPVRSPLTMAMIGTFAHYPDPPDRVEVVEYVTRYPDDPVMERRFGHDPADPAVGPRSARRVVLPAGSDHNRVLAGIVAAELKQLRPRRAPAPPAPAAPAVDEVPRSEATDGGTAPDAGR